MHFPGRAPEGARAPPGPGPPRAKAAARGWGSRCVRRAPCPRAPCPRAPLAGRRLFILRKCFVSSCNAPLTRRTRVNTKPAAGTGGFPSRCPRTRAAAVRLSRGSPSRFSVNTRERLPVPLLSRQHDPGQHGSLRGPPRRHRRPGPTRPDPARPHSRRRTSPGLGGSSTFACSPRAGRPPC